MSTVGRFRWKLKQSRFGFCEYTRFSEYDIGNFCSPCEHSPDKVL